MAKCYGINRSRSACVFYRFLLVSHKCCFILLCTLILCLLNFPGKLLKHEKSVALCRKFVFTLVQKSWKSELKGIAKSHPCQHCIIKLLRGSLQGLPDITGRTALAVQPDVVNAKYHVITNATYNRDPVPAKFKHVTNIDTCTLLCCDYSTLWEALHVNMVEIGARCSDKNIKILEGYQWIGW